MRFWCLTLGLLWVSAGHASALHAAPQAPVEQAPPPARCRVEGHITSSGVPLPGVSITVRVGEQIKAVASTDVSGHYALVFAPGGRYQLSLLLTGFSAAEREVTVGSPPCDQAVDATLALATRTPAARTGAPSGSQASTGAPPGRSGSQGGRFQALSVGRDAVADGAGPLGAPSSVETPSPVEEREIASLLPPGFAAEDLQTNALTIAGARGATSVNRGGLNARLQAIDAGQLDLGATPGAPGAGPLEGGGAPFGGGGGGFRGIGGPGGPPGGGGRGGFALGGRSARGQNPYQGSAISSFGGSALSSAPYQLRPDVPAMQPQFAQNQFGATFGGPLKIPGLYADADRRTNFQINYTGSQANNVFDQYATVPTDAMRSGDFSATPIQLVDPGSGQPFQGNQLPSARIDPAAASLLVFIPRANLPGSTQNYHVSTTAHSSSQALSVRLTQSLSPAGSVGGPGGRGGFGGGGGLGGFGGFGRRPDLANGRGTNVLLNVQLQYRQTDTQRVNIFPGLGGGTINRSLTVPVSLNVVRGRTIQNFSVNLTHATTDTTNAFAGATDVAGLAGIQYPSGAALDPASWNIPTLSFSGLASVRNVAASARTDDRVRAGYFWLRPTTHHRIRIGGDVRFDAAASQINPNPQGAFTFTGLYSGGGAAVGRSTGADFADFLLGLPQQATLQVGGTSHLRQRAVDAFVEDNWQPGGKLTLNLGLRYELALPYVEINGRMANLDAAPGLVAVAPVLPGGVGLYTGRFPAGLLNSDVNNLGPRLGMAYRVRPHTTLRAGYSVTYNSGSYASIARELAGQPPFADTETVVGGAAAPLTLAEALVSGTSAANNWGVDRDYALGTIQTWNAVVVRNLTQNWVVQAGYTGIKGTNLDVLRAPALGVAGPTSPEPAAFIWESSGGRSMMHAGNVQLQRRLAHGYSGNVSYTLARSMDNASSLGSGGPIVAQNDQNLGAEWARSNFDRRHQVSCSLYVELPWGPNRRWLADGGAVASVFGEWSAQFNLTWQSGQPLTARVLGAANDLLRGVNGALRADYNGAPIQLSNPTVDEFFNTQAFSAPGPGQFGTAARNTIGGPGTRQMNGLFQRDLRLGGNRSLTLQANATNLLNTVQWAAVDTNVNSPTFGHVLSARPMRAVTIAARVRF